MCKYYDKLKAITGKLDQSLGELDCLRSGIQDEIRSLEELSSEVCERADKLACALDLNKKWEQ